MEPQRTLAALCQGESFQGGPDRVGGSKVPSQSLCLKSFHKAVQRPLPSKEMYFREDVWTAARITKDPPEDM